MTDMPPFQSTRPPPDEPREAAVATSGTPPPNYCVIRPGSGNAPEILFANDDAEMLAQVQRQVRTGQLEIVYVYRLCMAEVFVPSSLTLTPDEVRQRFAPKTPESFPVS